MDLFCGNSSPFVQNGNDKLFFASSLLLFELVLPIGKCCFGFVIYHLCANMHNAFGYLFMVHVLEEQFSGLLCLFIYCTSFGLFKASKVSVVHFDCLSAS